MRNVNKKDECSPSPSYQGLYMPRCTFSYGQIAEVLAAIHHIAPEKRVAFHSRLKHFQRESFPTGRNPGKGKALTYSVEHLFKMVIALELVQAGMGPKIIVSLIDKNWSTFRTTIYLNMFTHSEREEALFDEPDDWCWLIQPEGLRDLTEEGEHETDQFEAVLHTKLSHLESYISAGYSSATGASWRHLLINGGPLVRGVITVVDMKLGYASRADIRHDILEAEDEAQAELKQAFDMFDKAFGVEAVAKIKARPTPKLADRYPALILDAAKEKLLHHRDLMKRLADAEADGSLFLSVEEITELRDAALLDIDAEGLRPSELGQLVMELLKEEPSDGEHP